MSCNNPVIIQDIDVVSRYKFNFWYRDHILTLRWRLLGAYTGLSDGTLNVTKLQGNHVLIKIHIKISFIDKTLIFGLLCRV